MAGTGWAGRPGSGVMAAEEEGAAGQRRRQTDRCRENEDSVHENHSSFWGKTTRIDQRWWVNCKLVRALKQALNFNESFHTIQVQDRENNCVKGLKSTVCLVFFSPRKGREILEHDSLASTSEKHFQGSQDEEPSYLIFTFKKHQLIIEAAFFKHSSTVSIFTVFGSSWWPNILTWCFIPRGPLDLLVSECECATHSEPFAECSWVTVLPPLPPVFLE